MASKSYTLVVDGEETVYGSKKTAVKYGDESGRSYHVLSPSGQIVHQVSASPEEAPVEEKEDEVADDTVYYEFLEFPGNYSIVTAPGALEIAQAAGVPAKSENIPGKLTRRVHFGGNDMDLTSRTTSLVQEAVAEALTDLREWQKKNIERRRGLTDMQRYVEHRDFIAAQLHKTALAVKKQGV